MLSRVAGSIYWMSRYLERMDNVARFIDVNARLILDMGREREETPWDPLVHASGDLKDFSKRYKDFSEKNVVRFLTFDKHNPNSIISCVHRARENARTVREIISSEMWDTINALYHFVEKHSRKRSLDDLQEFFRELHQYNQMFIGHIANTMSRGEAWHFARVGRLLERADKTARILDVKYFLLLPKGECVDSPYDSVEWGAVLKSVSGFEMYRKQFHGANYRDVIQFLILDAYFPRSVRFCIHTAAYSLGQITEMLGVDVPATGEIGKLCDELDHLDVDTILDRGMHEVIDLFQINMNNIDEAIYTSFFSI